jgi:ribosomal protein L7Ae-like RNA K-turn-binding protein
MKAGKLITGTDKICDEIRRHGMPSDEGKGYSTCGIVIIASDASDNTKKRITNACAYYRVEAYRSALTQEQIADKIGKSTTAACATFDRGFADGIRKAISTDHFPSSNR